MIFRDLLMVPSRSSSCSRSTLALLIGCLQHVPTHSDHLPHMLLPSLGSKGNALVCSPLTTCMKSNAKKSDKMNNNHQNLNPGMMPLQNFTKP